MNDLPGATRIHILPPELASQIAAGEVVERPASVLKELVENALDAGARRIEVEFEGGGRERLLVVDDGCGMTPEEARLAVERHATSKLRSADDLFRLATLGFRGEALPSIAAVAEVSIVTRAAGADEGFRLQLSGLADGAPSSGPEGAPRGTRIEVRRLFERVPARLKFLKAEATESAHLSAELTRIALTRPEVHFRMRSGGRVAIDLPPHRTLLERARAALAASTRGRGAAELHAAAGTDGTIAVEACLAPPAAAAPTARHTHLIVNGRPVRDRGLLHALALGYGETLERGRYPLAVLRVDLPPGDVDVNVHPQKAEVRFARPHEVAQAVRRVVRDACARAPWLSAPAAPLRAWSLPPGEGESPPRASDGGGFAEQRARIREALSLFARPPSQPEPPSNDAGPWLPPVDLAAAREAGAPRFFADLRYLGQLHRTYLVCEADGELVLIDQHAAHERVAFERLRAAHRARALRTQRLLFPATVELDEAQALAASEHAPALAALGFELEPFGGASHALKGIPEGLDEAEGAAVLAEVLDQVAAAGAAGEAALTDRLDLLLATMACHSVVRAGDVLDAARARALLESMDGVDFRAHCPHGRPVVLRLPLGELERRFGR